jgi:hypothetical protein
VDEGPSLPVVASGNAECAQEHTTVEYSHHICIGAVSNKAEHFENGHTDSDRCALDQDAHFSQIEKHVKKMLISATVSTIKCETFIYLDLMIKNRKVPIEMYFKWWTSTKLV